jgi:hypothetical protein
MTAFAEPICHMKLSGFILLIGLLVLSGCFRPGKPSPDVSHQDPSVKIPSIKRAVRLEDMKVVEQLVADLSSDDPAVRFYAIGGLDRLTGERFGYIYYDDEVARQPSVDRWKEWLKQQQSTHSGHSASSQPTQ